VNFIADGMLGKLARWLRIMGHNVTYSTKLDDPELLVLTKETKRVLLTRDLALYQQAIAKNLESYYVEGTTEPQRLSELAHRFNIPLMIDLEKTRCPKCNTKLWSAPKEKIAAKVETNTFLHYDVFWECHNCKAVYWQGAHWKKIRATLEQAKEKLKEKKDEA
jgi:hypothetical protein